jgi:hypothetical protein
VAAKKAAPKAAAKAKAAAPAKKIKVGDAEYSMSESDGDDSDDDSEDEQPKRAPPKPVDPTTIPQIKGWIPVPYCPSPIHNSSAEAAYLISYNE